jgi:hypothetical protein
VRGENKSKAKKEEEEDSVTFIFPPLQPALVNSENNGKLISQRRNHGSMKADGFQVVPLVYTPGHKRAGGKKKEKNGGETEMKCARWRTFFQSCDFHKACLFLVFFHPITFSLCPPPSLPG